MRRLNLNFLLLTMLAVFPAAAQTNAAGAANDIWRSILYMRANTS